MICLYYKTACTVAEDTRKNYKYFNEGKEKEKPAYISYAVECNIIEGRLVPQNFHRKES